jgi:hypothetical protein
MKKLILNSLFIFLIAVSSVKADTKLAKVDDGIEKISSDVLRHFGYSFYRASNISWTINNAYQKATFMLNGKTTYALYDLSSRFLVATQLTEVGDLPEKIKENLKKDFADYKVGNILKVIERPGDYQFEDDTNAYWLDLNSKTEQVVAVSLNSSSLSIVKTLKLK